VKIRAKVKIKGEQTMNKVAEVGEDGDFAIRNFPMASFVEISRGSESGDFFLVRHDSDGNFAGDTCHDTVDEAKRQAAREFGIQEADWKDV